MITGMDLYIGNYVDRSALSAAISETFSINIDAIVDYDHPDSVDITAGDRWVFLHKIQSNPNFSYKAEVEMFFEIDWLSAIKELASKLGVEIYFFDEIAPTTETVKCALPNGGIETRSIHLDDIDESAD